MSKPQTRCVFCNGTPATKGHIWPEWFDRYLPPKASHHQEVIGEILTFNYTGRGPERQERIRSGHSGSRKPRNTCLACNTGWMSRLEQANIPQMSRLIQGKRTLLSVADQWLLASLLCLITIRVEFTDREMQGIPPSDRLTLMNNGHPPFSWGMWIAEYSGQYPEDHWSRHFGMQMIKSPHQPMGPHKCNTQVTTMVIGRLCFHNLSSSVMPIPSGYSGLGLTRIWPPTHIYVDTSRLPTLSERDVIELHEAFPASLKVAH